MTTQGFYPFLAASLLFGSYALGQDAGRGTDRAEDFLKQCKGESRGVGTPEAVKETLGLLDCLSYLRGFIDGSRLTQMTLASLDSAPKVNFICYPSEGISNEQARRIVVKFIEDHPGALHLNKTAMVFGALANAFPPCKSKD